MAEFKMPSLGADMDSGTLYEWFVKPGAIIKRGDVIASVETDKGVIDIECFEEGLVTALLVEPATRVPVGQVIALIGESGVQPAIKPTAPVVAVETAKPAPPVGLYEQVTPIPKPENLKISPAARRLAEQLGVDIRMIAGTGSGGVIHSDDVRLAASAMQRTDPLPMSKLAIEKPHITPIARRMVEQLHVDLEGVQGTGPHGAIGKADVTQALEAQKVRPPVEVEKQPPVVGHEQPAESPITPAPEKMDFAASMRRAIALAMAKSNREIPHYYLETRVDMSVPLAKLEIANAKRSLADRILPVVLLIKATALALVDVPELNGFWRDDHFEAAEAIHIGFAISLRQGGLVTPAIHDADEKTLDELMAAMRDLITRTRGGRLRSSELTDATITLTSLGDTGVEKVYGVIYPPQVALVGFGKIMEQPWTENGMLGIRPILTVTLAGDHRASDGRRGAQFLGALEKHLRELETT